MPITLSEKFLAYLALFSGLFLSLVAEYYSILGLTAIFAAAVIPVIIMGIALGLGKVTATLWLKQNWDIAPWTVRAYLFVAIIVLMLITSMGIFGFLSKAHSDQTLVSGDVQSKIAIYDEKIKTARENIEADRRQLKQMDEAVDQVMARSTDEKGADKSNAIRRSQQRDRAALAKDIEANQKLISALNDEAAPIRAEVRKVEAEVGPIKYIAAFVYGDTDQTVLEKAVTWVIIILIVVFDPMAVILLLSSQISFQNFRERNKPYQDWTEEDFEEISKDAWVADVGEKPTEEELDEIEEEPAVNPHPVGWMFPIDTSSLKKKEEVDPYAYLKVPFKHFENLKPMPAVAENEPAPVVDADPRPTFDFTVIPSDSEYITVDGERMHIRAAKDLYKQTPKIPEGYVQNEEQTESGVWNRVISESEYREQAQAKLQNDSKNNPDNAA